MSKTDEKPLKKVCIICAKGTIEDVYARGINRIQRIDSGEPVDFGPIDIGKHLRPNWRGGQVVLFVDASTEPGKAPWRALKLL